MAQDPRESKERSGVTGPKARTRPDQATNPNAGKVKLDEKASPTKPQQVHDENVNRPHSSS